MVRLPDPTVDAIYQTYVDAESKTPIRDYLGGSELGEECCRRLWYSFRHVHKEQFDGRMLRLFDSGKREEARVIAELRSVGVTVEGEQYEVSACDGHLKGHLDGVCKGLKEAPETWHVLEIKTHNRKSYTDLEKKGVMGSKPKHWHQMQLYMGLTELDRAVYVAVCKDTDDIWLERVNFDRETFAALLLKARRIIRSSKPLEKISQDPAFFVCRFCPYNEHCHGTARPAVNCRTCRHLSPEDEGKWECDTHNWTATSCPEHIFIPALLPWAKDIDGDVDYVKYRMPDGREFINAAASAFPASELPHYSSEELAAIPLEAIGDEAVEMVRKELGGIVTR